MIGLVKTRVFYHPRGITFCPSELAVTDPLYHEIVALHGPPRADEVIFSCADNGEQMYVWRWPNGRYGIRHKPGGSAGDHQHGRFGSPMSVEHQREAEYCARSAQAVGLRAHLEHSTGNGTRLDVAIYGDTNTGIEIQRSKLTTPQALSRTQKSFKGGWPTAWVSDTANDPNWADKVPTARLISRGVWSEGMPAPNTAYIAISTFYRERNRDKPTGWWYQREPRRVLLDELAYLMPAGLIVPVRVGTKGHVVLAEKSAVDVIDSCTYPGASLWNPNQPTKTVIENRSGRGGGWHQHRPSDTETVAPSGNRLVAPSGESIWSAGPLDPMNRLSRIRVADDEILSERAERDRAIQNTFDRAYPSLADWGGGAVPRWPVCQDCKSRVLHHSVTQCWNCQNRKN